MNRLELRIDLGTIRNNALEIRKRIPESVKLACVVKANAYGHNAVKTAGTLSDIADAFAVATPQEGRELVESGISKTPIIVLGQISDFEDARISVKYGLRQAVDNIEYAKMLSRAAGETSKRASIHIKLDTGMRRTGIFDLDELAETVKLIDSLENVDIDGAFTHFCAADSDEAFTELQNERFTSAVETIRALGFNPVCHAAASTAMLNPEYQRDMVRAGIALYGTGVDELKGIVKPAQTLISHPVSIRKISAGESVGYSRTYFADSDRVIATIPCGYGDGYPRLMSNKGFVLIEGRRAPIVGNVCMDMLMADVSDIPNVSIHSPVILMGRMGNEEITPDEIAHICSTIPYEIMLGFTDRVKKVYI